MSITANPTHASAATFTLEAVDSLGNVRVAQAPLTNEQINALIDTAKRLQAMAILGVPTVPGATFTGLQMDLALHALMTAFVSLADAFPLHTQRAALMADRASLSLHLMAAQRAATFPQQIQ